MGSQLKKNAAAVVVSFNRLEKVKRCVSSILSQSIAPSTVIVVDNASTDGTGDWLASAAQGDPRIRPLHLLENTGGAGGFHAGIKLAVQVGAEYVWVMDDDSYPRGNVLELLLRAYSEQRPGLFGFPAFACARVLCVDGVTPCEMNTPTLERRWDFPYSERSRAVAAQSCSFVSCLFRAEDVRRVGLPLKEYFIWLDDIEFTRRLARGTYGLVVLDAVALHDVSANERVDWCHVTSDNVWKYQYGARNEGSWRFQNQGLRSYLWFVRNICRQMKSGSVSLKCRWAIYVGVLKALRFNPKPEMPD